MDPVIYLYSLARRERGGTGWCDLVVGGSQSVVRARLLQNGIHRPERWAELASLNPGVLQSFTEAGPCGESYKLVAVAVTVPRASELGPLIQSAPTG